MATAPHLPEPVPVELQQQIIQGEFIDFDELLDKHRLLKLHKHIALQTKAPSCSLLSMKMLA